MYIFFTEKILFQVFASDSFSQLKIQVKNYMDLSEGKTVLFKSMKLVSKLNYLSKVTVLILLFKYLSKL